MNKTKLTKLALTAALGLALTLLSCEDKEKKQTPAETQTAEPAAAPPPQEAAATTLTDSRDKKTYKTVKIGTQTWMAENLNYEAKGSKCYEDKPANCQKYGRLYNWETAKTACPSGWKLPSNAEWDKLLHYIDGTSGTESPYYSETAGKHLKAKSGWNENGNGTDKFGFSALPSGVGYSHNGSFNLVGSSCFWWSSTEYSSSEVYYWFIHYNSETVQYNGGGKGSLYSIRCIKD